VSGRWWQVDSTAGADDDYLVEVDGTVLQEHFLFNITADPTESNNL
jgi:hypothetical protein